MTFDNTYRFLLDGAEIAPIIGNELKIEDKKENNSFFFRKKLSDEIKLFGAEYRTINESVISQKFTFKIQKFNGSIWEDEFDGYFYKTDCSFDDDWEILTVKPTADDGWEDLKKVLNNEYNLRDILPDTKNVNYKLRPVLQIIYPRFGIRNEKILNIIGATTFTEDIGVIDHPDTLTDLNFTKTSIPFDSSTTQFHNIYTRYLTTLDTFNGVATVDRLETDISSISKIYTKTSDQIIIPPLASTVRALYQAQDLPTKYGRVNDEFLLDCPAFTDKYYAEYDDPSFYSIPLVLETFGCESLWYIYFQVIADFELANSEDIVLQDAYTLEDGVQKLLEQETDIVFANTADYSEFLYSAQDPIAGEVFNLLFTAKSNIVNSGYDEPARKLNIRLSEIFQMLQSVFNVYWHIEKVGNEKRLRLEHVKWYENGGTYNTQGLNIDLTNTFDSRNNKSLCFAQNKFKYKKQNMPQRYEYKWADSVSEVFEGQPIRVLSEQIEKGLIEQRQVNKFTSDLNYTIANQNISLDGFFLIAGTPNGLDYDINVRALELKTNVFIDTQNGFLSNQFLLPAYHGYGMPAEEIEINGVATTANSITRNKQQSVDFTYEGLVIDPLKLIKTDLGSGQIESLSLNLINNKYKAIINHDTE